MDKENSLKETIIQDMCLTYDHSYGIDFSSYDEKSLELFGLSNEEKQGIYRRMKQIFENCIEPKMTYKIFNKPKNNMKEPLKIKVMYHDNELVRIEKIHIGDWIDLRCAEDVEMKQGEYKLLSLGVSIELPSGYEAHVLPRSSTYKNFGIILSNSQGVIDNTYKNSQDLWRFPAIAMRDTKINKNDRICQFRIVKNMEEVLIEEVDNLDHNDMRGGIGSTGVN